MNRGRYGKANVTGGVPVVTALHKQLRRKDSCKEWDLLMTDLEYLHVSTDESDSNCNYNKSVALINITVLETVSPPQKQLE